MKKNIKKKLASLKILFHTKYIETLFWISLLGFSGGLYMLYFILSNYLLFGNV